MSLVLAACGAPGATFAGISTGDVTSTGGFARSVPIGNGRSIFLECRGSGSPTVVLVSGTGGASDEWALAVDPTDPAARPRPSASAVLPTVASFTRVCAHDRPGTTRNDGRPSPSTRVSQPTTAEDGARDLRAVLAAAGERRPYVIVGASWGAMIALLLARTDSPQVAGLVTVDGASEFLKKELSPAQWSGWMHKIEAMDAADGREVPDYESSVHELRAAPAMPRPLPAVVLTSDKPWDLQVEGTGSTWPAWLAAQDRLAAELCARHITDTRSGHGIGVEQPQMVSTAIREVVDEARNKP
ncbi:alpha/beta hydrolase [Streptomyces sp. NPDC006283]|uniref:alpha/beta fold hydrolase n=1 Tax=Streptomyces sp. NPDC006283 TaxID=3156741 RepID=UPI0033B87C6F